MHTNFFYAIIFFCVSSLLSDGTTYNGVLNPRVSIISSIYKGDEFIEGFMKDIVQQTMFDQYELLLINANSPGNEEEVIKGYLAKYPNIRYIKLEEDPGLYGV